MRSSTGAHYVSLDHLRALAALLVFEWHFIHPNNPPPSIHPNPAFVPFQYVPTFFPAAIVNEGHCGVALFMCLSGYLFAKLLDGKQINFWAFLWNRFIRLVPLLLLVIIIVGLKDYRYDPIGYSKSVLMGAILPTLPNGGWSITVEAHFYLVLPVILLLLRRHVAYAALIVLAAILLRIGIYFYCGEIQTLAYLTIIGRIDQFILGIVAFNLKNHMEKRHILMFAFFICFAAFYWYYNALGGFYYSPSYPSPHPIWIIMTTIEALFFSSLIAYYDSSFQLRDTGISGIISKVGTYSYSIYLTHFFYVFWMARVFLKIFPIHNFYFAIVGGLAGFSIAAVLGSLSYHFIELPFLKRRQKYIVGYRQQPGGLPGVSSIRAAGPSNSG